MIKSIHFNYFAHCLYSFVRIVFFLSDLDILGGEASSYHAILKILIVNQNASTAFEFSFCRNSSITFIFCILIQVLIVLHSHSGFDRIPPGHLDPHFIELQRRMASLPPGAHPQGGSHIPGVYPPASLASDLIQRERERLDRLGRCCSIQIMCLLEVAWEMIYVF